MADKAIGVQLQSRIFQYKIIDSKDEMEDVYENCYSLVEKIMQGKGEREIKDQDSINKDLVVSNCLEN